jgi:hypothetical protein
MPVVIVWNEPVFNHVFKSWAGPVGRHIDGIADTTARVSRGLAGKRSGALIGSIGVAHEHTTGGDVLAKVGTNVPSGPRGYALWHHEGTGTWAGRGWYPIRARRAKMLRFRNRAGVIVFAKQVRHPGSVGRKYLIRALRFAMRSS